MREPENDTTEVRSESQNDQKPGSHSYYYDDSTGYEVYEPAKAPEEDEPEE
jgi:hypothetical protein